MSRPVPLNNVDHAGLRVRPRHAVPDSDPAPMSALVVPREFRAVQTHYPIVFQQTDGGAGFQPLALFGFEPGENLFAGADGWDADVLPLSIEREPFFIGREGDALTVHVDADSPRLHDSDGEPLFLPHGGSSEYLERVNTVLGQLHAGIEETPAYIAALREHGLLESFVFDVELDGGAQHRLAGYHTVHEERLAALDAAALDALHRAGYLLPTYMALASLSRLADLVRRRQRLRHRQPAER